MQRLLASVSAAARVGPYRLTANSAVCLLLTDHAPWIVVKRADKMRGRINTVRHLLSMFNYDDKDVETVGEPDPLIGRRCPG